MSRPLLSLRQVRVSFPVASGLFAKPKSLHAVNGVNLDLHAGETLGVVGESGCGKSTLARAILGLVPAAAGSISLLGKELTTQSSADWQKTRRDLQVVFQDPLAALNPRMTVGEIIGEPLGVHEPDLAKEERRRRVRAMMKRVGLLPNQINRYPHEFSGGQCQRIGIARALILEPKVVICDEPVSALDVSIQAQIVNLLIKLKHELQLSLIFIAHDLAVVRHISDRVMVMYLGKVVEVADAEELYRQPRHPYSRALLSAIPVPDPDYKRERESKFLRGELPSPLNPPSGCAFRTRCPLADGKCAQDEPGLRSVGGGASYAACHYVG